MAKAKPRYKSKGPIRVEAIIPFAVVMALIAAYFALFFDAHLRSGIEWSATQANGAEVNVGYLKTSFLNASFEMGKIEVTNLAHPAENKFEVGQLRVKLLWDALLRAKFVVDAAAVNNIEVATPRKKPGFIVPAPDPKDSMATKFFQQAKERVSSTALSGVGQILEGLDPVKNIGQVDNLKSVARVNELKTELGKKETEWQQSLAKMPGEKDYADLQARINAVSTGGVSNPAEIANRANQVKNLIQETNGKIAAVQGMAGALTGDIGNFQKSIGEIDNWVKSDREDLEKKLKIPSVDAKGLSEQLLGSGVLGKVGQAEHYIQLARKYMPAKKAKKAAPQGAARARGTNYEFPVTNSYPLFWLKKAEISSKGEHSPAGGDVAGELRDVTTNPAQIGRPAVLTLKGDFPKKELRNLEVQLTVDHRTETPMENLKASIGAYPVHGQMLSESDTLKFGLDQAAGSAAVSAAVKGDTIDLSLKNTFKNVSYNFSAQSKILEATFQSVLKELPQLDVQAHVYGPWDGLQFSVDSNLGRALEQGFGKQLQAKLAEARKKLDDLIQAKVGKPKQELTSRFNDTKTRVTGEVDRRRKQAEGLKTQAEAKLKAVTNQAGSVQKKAADTLKKKFGF